jgi:hypothetical protein
VSFSGGSGFPPFGSYDSTLYDQERHPTYGGSTFNWVNPVDGNTYWLASEICDVDVLNDGAGGTFQDWANLYNVRFKSNGDVFYSEYTTNVWTSGSMGVNVNGNIYPELYEIFDYWHDGAGSYASGVVRGYYIPSGVLIYQENEMVEVPSTSGNNFSTGRLYPYYWDGDGGFYAGSVTGSYHPAGTFIYGSETATGSQTPIQVPSGSGNNYDSVLTGTGYTWNGSGDYNTVSSWYYAYGTFIYDDGTDAFFWNGTGGYYSEPL